MRIFLENVSEMTVSPSRGYHHVQPRMFEAYLFPVRIVQVADLFSRNVKKFVPLNSSSTLILPPPPPPSTYQSSPGKGYFSTGIVYRGCIFMPQLFADIGDVVIL